MNIDYPIIYEIAYNTYAINEFGMVSFFVLVGKERGLVIDCGCASFNAKELIGHLCPVPYDVVLTHHHGEHCNGMGFFDHVWIHPLEMDYLKNLDELFDRMYHNSAIWEGASRRGLRIPMPDGREWNFPSRERGAKDFYDFKNISFTEFDRRPDLLSLADGQVFLLDGSRSVAVIHLPGHTPGHCAFLDSGSRILFSGDGCCPNQSIRETSVTTAYRGFLRLNEFCPEFDRIFSSHTASGADTAGLSLPLSLLADCLTACQTVLDGTVQVKDTSYASHGFVRLRFDPNRLIDKDETPIHF